MEHISLSFPKVWAIGQPHIKDIFDGDIVLEEKVDGSQFGGGVFNGELFCRSKGVKGIQDNPPDMFRPTVDHIKSVQDKLIPGTMYWGEAIKDKKHNTLTYSRVPRGYLVLFAAQYPDGSFAGREDLEQMAYDLKCEVVPCFYRGKWECEPTEIFQYLEKESFLGGPKVEGVVVKNYNKDYMLGGQYFPFMAGKYVSEKFKEKHSVNWKRENTGKGRFEVLCENYRNERRWEKAVQHLAEEGRLEHSPRDIGELIKEIKRDIIEEEKEEIKEELWKIFSDQLIRNSVKGAAEWYKERLVDNV